MWGGSLAIERLRRDVDLLLALHLVEPAGAVPYRLTAIGAEVLSAFDAPCGVLARIESRPS